MNLYWFDWTIVVVILLMLLGITFFGKRYSRSVSDFLAANRLAGRYLLTVSSGFGGAITLIATWEMTYSNGLPATWWGMMGAPLGLFIALTGFVVYRFRETRALTLAQFFEMRYSRSFRFFSGALCWISGILNFGIFPAVTTRFIIYFFGFPESFLFFGLSIPLFPVIMFLYLSIALYIACAGGQICIMLTDFFQGMLLLNIFLLIMFYLLIQFNWYDIMAGLSFAPENKSLINPFHTSQASDFNIWYFLIGLIGAVYGVRAWQGNSGYNSSAKTPHEAVMAGIISSWRTQASSLCMLLLPLTAYAVLHSESFAELAAPIQAQLDMITDPAVKSQMTVPLFLSHLLPVGMLGLFAVVIIACAISCDDTYMHAWGTILIQDVVMPLRKKPFAPKQHIKILRFSIVGVAFFSFIFSLLFPLKDYIYMYFAMTGAIYLGGAGSVIIGGLYWKRGSTPAAWTAMILGTVFGVSGIVLQQIWTPFLVPVLQQWQPDSVWLMENAEKFPINGQYIYGLTMLVSVVGYVLVSLLGPRHEHNMDRLLHRGQYAAHSEFQSGQTAGLQSAKRFNFNRLIGINDNFSRFDRFIAYFTTLWGLSWWGIFLLFTTLALSTSWLTMEFWIEFWWWKLIPFSIILGTVCSIWIIIGGCCDSIRLLKDLKQERIDDKDNGYISEISDKK